MCARVRVEGAGPCPTGKQRGGPEFSPPGALPPCALPFPISLTLSLSLHHFFRLLLLHLKGNVTISNDGATIMRLLEVVHPAAKVLVDISLSQDSEAGDGTTTVVLLAGELLREVKGYVEEGVHPAAIARALRGAGALAGERLRELAIPIGDRDDPGTRATLVKCAATALNSKLVSGEGAFFAAMVVDAVLSLDPATLDLAMLGIKKVQGGGLRDSFLVDGVAFKKTFSYAGFEMAPKAVENPKVLALNIELELKAEKDNAEVRLTDPADYQAVVDAEWNIIYAKLQACADAGATVVLSRLAIGDLATQWFSDRSMFCAGRVPADDMARVCAATGAAVQATTAGLAPGVLGTCAKFEERQVGGDRFNFFTGCVGASTATMVLRGGSLQFIDEAERSLHDAVCIVRRALQHASVVTGGGAVDMEISACLRARSRELAGADALFYAAYAKALEVIPRQLATNAGLDATDVLNRLRQAHAAPDGAGARAGLDVNTGGVVDAHAAFVWEPALVKAHALAAATEAACLVLSVDETVRNPRSGGGEGGGPPRGGAGGRGRGRGRGMRR